MSPNGHVVLGHQLPSALVIDLAANDRFDWHAHDHHQLALATRGVLILAVDGVKWVLPRSRALWIPAGIRHAVTVSGETTMVSLYVDPAGCPINLSAPTVMDAGGLLGELVQHLSETNPSVGERSRAEAVLWDLLVPLPVTALPLPIPADDRARRLAESLLRDVADQRTLADWGRAVGSSARTLARLFVAETGMGFARWRTNARIAAALPHLAAGRSVGAVARQVGYATPSAFVASFHREVGTTPAEYFRSHRP